MSANSNNQGRAYEFICLQSLYSAIAAIRPVEIVRNSSYMAAKSAWETLDAEDRKLYSLSAGATVELMFAKELSIDTQTCDVFRIYIKADECYEVEDVCYIVIEFDDIVWEIGFSINYKPALVKHYRLSNDVDLGEKMYGVKYTQQYWDETNPIFSFLAKEKDKGTYFRDISSIEEKIYVPLLNAFMNEIKAAIVKDACVPRRLVERMLSKYNFYNVIGLGSQPAMAIQSYNIFSIFNKASRVEEPKVLMSNIELPKELLYIGFKKSSKTTVLICFDNGWQFSFRIHNAEDKVNTSLKFDIQIVGMPVI